ncbi:unnamed protein product [Caenorhabditis sp. 36 PRJEB53466]|nr:unnamed protein product [Caenorhabditis sp. 36 PRJEB53466]
MSGQERDLAHQSGDDRVLDNENAMDTGSPPEVEVPATQNTAANEPMEAANPTERAPEPARIEVRIKTLDDRETTMSIGIDQTIGALVNQGRSQLGITDGFQRVIFQGRVLEPTMTLQNVGIANGHTVHLVDRAPGGNNDRPNIVPPPGAGRHFMQPMPPDFIRRMVPGMGPDREPPNHIILPPIRVPGAINGLPVISSRFAEDIFLQETQAIRLRGNPPPSQRNIPPRDLNTPAFNFDPHAIHWGIRIVDGLMFRPRENIEDLIKTTIRDLPFLDEAIKSLITLRWDANFSELRIEFPQVSPHIPSPALEKLDFLCFWVEHMKKFLDKVEEQDGLVAAARNVLEMAKARHRSDGLTQIEREHRMNALDDIVRQLEILSTELSHMKDYERDRFKKNDNLAYRNLKIQEYSETPRHPRFYMRHALDIDMTSVLREFRIQRDRLGNLEDLMDDLTDAGAIKYARDIMSSNRDYRYQALSVFFNYMQRMRHQVSHMSHVVSELDVSFLTPSHPQRLLPQYATNLLTVPFTHAATLILNFVSTRAPETPFEIPVTAIIEPPRRAADVGDRVNGDWPYLPFHPPSVHMDGVLQTPRRIPEPRMRVHQRPDINDDIPLVIQPPTQRGPAQSVLFQHEVHPRPAGLAALVAEEPTLTEFLQAQQDSIEAAIAQHGGFVEGGRVRVTARGRRVMTTGDAPSVPVETMPPPGEPQLGPSVRRARLNIEPNARGPETATLAALPVQIEPSDVQRIARNIASRYRPEALHRIAASLTERFNQESWDTRIQNMPLCTLRDSIALALELLVSAGSNITESRDLMLALVRDEDVLVRAVAECVKSLFGRGEFPTHVSRLIMPRNEAASARTDYESVDSVEESTSDELESMIVRVPSDVSQPQSGDLRAIRDRRASRRQFLENRPRPQSSTLSTVEPRGPSFNPEDQAEIRAGRLPLSNRTRRTIRDVNAPSTPPTVHSVLIGSEQPAQLTATFHVHAAFPAFGPSIPGPSSSSSTGAGPSLRPGERPAPPSNFVVFQVPESRIPPSTESPTLSMRNLLDFEIGIDPTSTPSPPAPTPRTISAPATVTSSPTRGESSTDGSSESPTSSAARQAARAARARIDSLAASFNGNLSEARRADPYSPNPVTHSVDPRRQSLRSQPPEPSFISSRPMVAIDPFMNCVSRHTEINRLQNPELQADADRYTLLSLQPDPELASHVHGLRPTSERRADCTPETDEDYNYDVMRNPIGELSFHDLETFQRFVRTTTRSLLSHVIDADTLVSINMNGISGHQGANHQELMNMVRRHVGRVPYGRYASNRPSSHRGDPRPREDPTSMITAYENDMLRRIEAGRNLASSPAPRMNRSPFRPGVNVEQELQIPSHVAHALTYLIDYMDSTSNPRPPGLFGLLLDMVHGRLFRHDLAQLARRNTAELILTENEFQFRDYLRRTYLSTRVADRLAVSNEELHEIASGVANDETFFNGFLSQNPQLPTSFLIGNDNSNPINVSWAFRQVEIALLKSLFKLAAQLENDPPTTARLVLECFDSYLYRNLMIFWRLSNRDADRQKVHLRRISDFFASIRFGNSVPPSSIFVNSFIENWNRIIEYWFDKYMTADTSEGLFTSFLLATRSSNDWNDINELVGSQPSTSSQMASSTSFAHSSSNGTVASNNNSRKRNHDGGDGSADCVDVVAPMTSLSTSSPSTSSSTQPGPPAPQP